MTQRNIRFWVFLSLLSLTRLVNAHPADTHNWYISPSINFGLEKRTPNLLDANGIRDYKGYGIEAGYTYVSKQGWLAVPYVNLSYDAWKLDLLLGGHLRPGEFDIHHPYQLTLGTGVLGGKRLIEIQDWGLDVVMGPRISYAVANWLPYCYRRWHLWLQGGLQVNYQRVFLRVSYSFGLLKRSAYFSWLRGRDVDLISLAFGWRF